MVIVVLNDGETWSDIDGCTIQFASAADEELLDLGTFPRYLHLPSVQISELIAPSDED